MKIKNISRFGALDVPLLGRVVELGEVVDVPDGLGEQLLAQARTWAAADDEIPGEDI